MAEPWGLQTLLSNGGIKSVRSQMMEIGLGGGRLVNILFGEKKS